jgi:hypothetical protein
MTVKGKTKLSLVAMLLVLALSLVLSIAPAASGCCECDCGPCTGTPGYWKNHPDAWPVENITVGGVTYTKDEAIDLLDGPVKGDKSITMFKAVVAAMLNEFKGCCNWCICETINEADTWLKNFPLGSGVRANSEAWQFSHGEALYWALDDYNNGRLECADARD